jgi:pimeloyl-ACP methyl ester carboxylesterase
MKPHLLILHGALGAKKQFTEIAKLLDAHFEVHTLEFDGHGTLSDYAGDLTIDHFASQAHATLRALGWEKPLVFGYSMGGYVALKLESEHPGTFSSILTLGTKFNWTPESAEQESRMLNPEKIQEKIPAFGLYLASLHGDPEWKILMGKTAQMMVKMGNHPPITEAVLAKVSTKTVCLRGSKDVMVNEEETRWAVNALPNAEFQEMAEWQHPIDKVPANELVEVILEKLG